MPEAANGAAVTRAGLVVLLERLSLAYLALPLVIFLIGFLHWAWAAGAVLSLAGALWLRVRRPAPNGGDESFERPFGGLVQRRGNLPVGVIIACALAALAASALLGPGGWGHQTWDWHKGNAMLTALVSAPWPVVLQTEEGVQYHLVYFIAYYLPAAALGKAFGFAAANHVLLVWSAFGLFLALSWLYAFVRSAALWMIPLFLFFSGLDVIGAFIHPDHPPVPDFFHHIEWWSKFQMSATLVGIAWVPQHVLPAWLLTGMTLKWLDEGSAARTGVLPATLGVLWSPFTTIGVVALLMVCLLMQHRRSLVDLARRALSPENALALLPLLCTCAYLLAGADEAGGGKALGIKPFGEAAGDYPLFITLNFLYLWVILHCADRYAGTSETPLVPAPWKRLLLVCLILASLFFGAESFDLQKNASHPCVFILLIATARLLEWSRPEARPESGKAAGGRPSRANRRKEAVGAADRPSHPDRRKQVAGVVVFLVFVGAWTPIVELQVALRDIHRRGALHQPVAPTSLANENIYARLYIARTDSLFGRLLAR